MRGTHFPVATDRSAQTRADRTAVLFTVAGQTLTMAYRGTASRTIGAAGSIAGGVAARSVLLALFF